MKTEIRCHICRAAGEYSILLCVSDAPSWPLRMYLPNQHVRTNSPGEVQEVWFCSDCMRKIEDNFRATVQYLESEEAYKTRRPAITRANPKGIFAEFER